MAILEYLSAGVGSVRVYYTDSMVAANCFRVLHAGPDAAHGNNSPQSLHQPQQTLGSLGLITDPALVAFNHSRPLWSWQPNPAVRDATCRLFIGVSNQEATRASSLEEPLGSQQMAPQPGAFDSPEKGTARRPHALYTRASH